MIVATLSTWFTTDREITGSGVLASLGGYGRKKSGQSSSAFSLSVMWLRDRRFPKGRSVSI